MPEDMPPPDAPRPPPLETVIRRAAEGRRVEVWAVGLVAGGVVLAVLNLAATFLIPLAVAIFLFSLLNAGIDRIERLRLGPFRTPRWAASVAALAALALGLFLVITLVTAQVNTLIAVGPGYIARAEAALAALATDLGEETAEGLVTAFRDLRAGDQLRALAGSAGGAMVTATLVTLYVGFMLAERSHLRRKLGRIAPEPAQAARVDAVIRSITRSVHRYILVKTLVSAVTGFLAYLVLETAGLELAKTIGLITFVLNFIPNIGSIVATVIAGIVVFVEFEDVAVILGVVGLLSAMQFTIGQVMEPLLVGRTLQLSPLIIVLSLVFWGLVWGPAGMFLAVPIMVTVLIVCAHVPSLRPVAVVLSANGDLPGEGELRA